MNHRIATAVGSISLIAMLALTGCASSNTADAGSGAGAKPKAASPSATPSPSPSESVSDIDAAVQTFTKALDDLGIQHTEPVRAEAGLSGAKARFDITVDNFEAGINVFPDADTLATWGKASDSFGGIYIASGNAVLSLNSSDGVADSAAIAPKIATAVKGEAHGV
ncbi:hypothetical protein [Glaciihabitans sp. UYNi722]|uniref:hypothetical protein n=1 Tax=Glaciihabitans sp. UYNi722 TaxID=3156344 RepID=UPI0033962108